MFRIKAVSWIVIRVLNMLTIPVLCISESCIEVKTSIFIFTFLCGASKGFTKAFKASFEAPQSSVIFKLFLFVQAWRVKLQETTTTKSLGYWVHPSKNQWIQKNLSMTNEFRKTFQYVSIWRITILTVCFQCFISIHPENIWKPWSFLFSGLQKCCIGKKWV